MKLSFLLGTFLGPVWGSIQVGQKYIVPSPQDLAVMPDWTSMVNACKTNKADTACIAAMNQFLSDIHLMVPDTQKYVSDLNDKVTTNKDLTKTKQLAIDALSDSVNRVAGQLLTSSDTLDAADASYATTLSGLQATVNNMVDPQQSPLFAIVNSQKQVMLDKLTALGTATSQYLASQNDNIKATASYIYSLFRNDQDIVGNTGEAALATSANRAATLTQDIQNIRDWWAGNISAEQGNLDAQKAKVANAKSDADTRARAAKESIATSIQTGIDTTLATARSEYLAQLATVSATIDALVQSSKAQFDTVFAAASANDTAVTAKIDANITSAQTQLDAIKSLIAVRVLAATTAEQDATTALLSNQAANMQTTVGNGNTLNGTISEMTRKISDTSAKIFRSSQLFMTNFANLASDASGSASGAMSATATTAGDSMSTLNGYIGGVAGGAEAASQSAAQTMSSTIAGARDSAAISNLKQITALADAIDTITTLVDLMKSKMGQSSDKADVQLDAISSSLDYSIGGLYDSLTDITKAISDKVAAAATSAHDRMVGIAALSSNARHDNEALLATTRTLLDSEIAKVVAARTDAGVTADSVALDGSSLARSLGLSNDGLATQVTALRAKLDASWVQVQNLAKYLQGNATASLAAFNASATALASNQLTTATAFINATGAAFNATVAAASSSAAQAAKDAAAALNTTSIALMKDFNSSAADVGKIVIDAKKAANVTMGFLATVPQMLTNVSNAIQKELTNMTTLYLAGMRSRVQTVQNGLLWTIGNKSADYFKQTDPRIQELNSSISQVASALATQLAFKSQVFDKSVFSLTPDQFRAALQVASYQVGNASVNQEIRYAQLDKNLTAASTQAAQQISALSANVSAYIPNLTIAADAQVASLGSTLSQKGTEFATFADALMAKLRQNAAAQEAGLKNVTSANQKTFDGIMAAAQAKSDSIAASLTNMSAAESARQEALANSMDSVIQTMISVSGNNAAALRDLQSQFGLLQASTFQMSAKLNSSLNNAVAAMAATAAKAEAETQAKLIAAQNVSVKKVASLGDRLAYAMDTLDSGSAADLDSLSAADADALTLARSLSSLSSDAKKQIRDLLAKIQSGEVSMNDVLSAKSGLDLAKIGTAEDLIVAFTEYMRTHLAELQASYTTETDKLEVFRSTVPKVLSIFTTAQSAALAESKILGEMASESVTVYENTVKDVLADSGTLITQSRNKLAGLKDSVPDVLKGIKDKIRAAVLAVESEQDAFASQLSDAASSTRESVITKLRNFRASKGKNNYALSTDTVALPTAAPLLSIEPPA